MTWILENKQQAIELINKSISLTAQNAPPINQTSELQNASSNASNNAPKNATQTAVTTASDTQQENSNKKEKKQNRTYRRQESG